MIRFYLLGICLAAAALITMDPSGIVFAVTLHPGDILVAGRKGTDGAVFAVDPATGAYTVISSNTHGSGPAMYRPLSVTMASDGQLWVTDFDVKRVDAQILKIDPTTGNRVALPAAPPLGPFMTREMNGRLVVTALNGIYNMNPVTGASTQISGDISGSGPALAAPEGFFLSGSFAVVANLSSVAQVDLTTGARLTISSQNVGTGPQGSLYDVALESAGSLLTTGSTSDASKIYPAITRVDPATGNRVVVTSPTVGGGVPLPPQPIAGNNPLFLTGIAVGSGGSIYTTASGNGSSKILKVDPVTGDRQLVSNMIADTDRLYFLAIVPANVPEPSTLALAAFGGASLLALRRRRK